MILRVEGDLIGACGKNGLEGVANYTNTQIK
jgi:hypothetical protein